MKPTSEFFSSAVRIRRNKLGFSQEELADRAGLHRTYITDIERGARNPSLRTIERVAKALEVSISELFRDESEREEVPASVEILLVEDNPHDVRLTLRAFKLAQVRNRVHVASDAEQALKLLFSPKRTQLTRPNLVLLDLGLPGMDGLELLRRIKGDARTQKIPIVVLTVSDNSSDMEECRRLGVASYIVKPVDFHRFSKVVPELRLSWMLLHLHVNRAHT